jgi:hypothetical protein
VGRGDRRHRRNHVRPHGARVLSRTVRVPACGAQEPVGLCSPGHAERRPGWWRGRGRVSVIEGRGYSARDDDAAKVTIRTAVGLFKELNHPQNQTLPDGLGKKPRQQWCQRVYGLRHIGNGPQKGYRFVPKAFEQSLVGLWLAGFL